MDVLTISLGRNILRAGRERERMRSYAAHLTTLHVIVLTRKEHGFSEIQHERNLHLYATNSRSRLCMLWDAFRIARNIIREKRAGPLMVSAQDPLEIGWFCWLLTQAKNTQLHIQVHGDYFSTDGWVGGSLARRLRRRAALTLLRHAPAIRVVSERIKQSLLTRGIPEKQITVLPIRPELEQFLNVAHAHREAPPYTFLYLGRLAPEKDIPRIVNAFAVVHRAHPQTNLRIVGSGEEEQKIKSLMQSHALGDAVTLVPWTEDVPQEMAKADVFLLASKHEAYALTLVEAMAVGLPVVTTDVGCVGEVVHDGVHGIVVYENGVEAYAHAMKKMIDDVALRKKSVEQGRKTAHTLAQATADQYAHAWVTAISKANEQV